MIREHKRMGSGRTQQRLDVGRLGWRCGRNTRPACMHGLPYVWLFEVSHSTRVTLRWTNVFQQLLALLMCPLHTLQT